MLLCTCKPPKHIIRVQINPFLHPKPFFKDMKHVYLSNILIRLAVFLTAAAAGPALRAQSVEPFSPYGLFSPSVESYQMTRCGNLLPSLYTGAMTFSLPLMTYSDPDFTIPVTLEYSFDGYKPGQHSGSVGYGWYLDCGGVITREVRGIPDEGDLDRNENYPCLVHGWRQAGSFRNLYDTQAGSIYSIQKRPVDYVPVNECVGLLEGYDPFSDTPMYASSNGVGLGYTLYDTAPDIYHFRFLGHSGDFMMLPDGTVRVYNSDIPHGELSISFTDNENFPWHVIITLTSGDGYEYRFDCEDMSEIPDCNGSRPNRASKSVSAYHLTRITAPNGRSVSFSYLSQRNPVITPRYGTLLDGVCNTNGTWEDEVYYNLFSSNGDVFKWVFTREGSSLLEKISVNERTGQDTTRRIVFRYASSQEDEYDGLYFGHANESCYEWLGTPRLLSSVSMYGRDGLADSATLTYMNAPAGTPKAFLHSVTGMKTGTYSFGYNLSGFTLPPNDTQNTDHWGYWNGSSISDLREHLVETSWMYNQGGGTEVIVQDGHSDSTYVVVLPDTTVVRRCATHLYDQMTDGVKEANPAYALCGALTRIYYPHGGRTIVEYESNKVTRKMNVLATETIRHLEPVDSLDAAATWVVGGVRVKNLVDSTGLEKRDTTRFSYTDPDANGRQSGILMSMPKYAETVQYVHRANASYEYHGMVGMASVTAIGFNNCCGFVLDRDPHVVYPSVTVIHPDGSSTEHRFTSVTDPGRSDSHSSLLGLPKHIFGPSDWFESDTRNPKCMVPASLDCRNLRGQPLSTVVRNAQGQELKRTEYDYSYDQVTLPRLCFNNILTFDLATYVVRSPLLASAVETERGVTVRTDRSYNALGQRKTEQTVCASDTLAVLYRYIHETATPSPSGYDRLLCDAARTRRHDGITYLLAAEHYDYDSLGVSSPTRIISRIVPENTVVTGLGEAALFTATLPLPTEVREFEYLDLAHLHRLTKASLPGGAYVSYTWDGNHIDSKTENDTPNITQFDWKDQIGLEWVKYPSKQESFYEYDFHNRPWKTRDAQGRPESVIHYNLKNE